MAPLSPAAAQTAPQRAALASDSNFILTTGSLGLLQVKLGKLAQEKGSSEVVRDFGKRMVADYTKANEELAAGAKQAAYPKPVLLRPAPADLRSLQQHGPVQLRQELHGGDGERARRDGGVVRGRGQGRAGAVAQAARLEHAAGGAAASGPGHADGGLGRSGRHRDDVAGAEGIVAGGLTGAEARAARRGPQRSGDR